MHRCSLLAVSIVALAAGCKDDAPPQGAPPAPEATGAPMGLVRSPKLHPAHVLAASPALRPTLLALPPDAGAEAADAGAAASTRMWSFDHDKAGAAPTGFEVATSAGKPGAWTVKAEAEAPSGPNVLAQLDADKTEARFLTAVLTEPTLRDGRVTVRCKPVAGKVDQACGIVLRYEDAKNYYVARANALEKDVNLYVVKDGKRTLVGGWKGAVFGDAWHELRVDAKSDHLEVWWDGARVYQADDKTFPNAGKVGLWTKADSVTYFDDLAVTPL